MGARRWEWRVVQPLGAAHFDVVASDLVDYGGADIMAGVDYLVAPLPAGVAGIVTNPPYKLAVGACKALDAVPYLALLLRDEFLGGHRAALVFPRARADADLGQLAALADDASPWLARFSRAQQYLLCVISCGMRAPRASPAAGSIGGRFPRLQVRTGKSIGGCMMSVLVPRPAFRGAIPSPEEAHRPVCRAVA